MAAAVFILEEAADEKYPLDGGWMIEPNSVDSCAVSSDKASTSRFDVSSRTLEIASDSVSEENTTLNICVETDG